MADMLYVAYGSNLNLKQMKFRCPGAKFLYSTMLKDTRLLFRGKRTGFLTIEYKEGAVTPIGVFSITPRDLITLDVYEGFPSFYYKAEVKLNEGEKGFVYIMDGGKKVAPSQSYIDCCAIGYKDCGLDYKYLQEALDELEMGKLGVSEWI